MRRCTTAGAALSLAGKRTATAERQLLLLLLLRPLTTPALTCAGVRLLLLLLLLRPLTTPALTCAGVRLLLWAAVAAAVVLLLRLLQLCQQVLVPWVDLLALPVWCVYVSAARGRAHEDAHTHAARASPPTAAVAHAHQQRT
jgi:hypothetical protein